MSITPGQLATAVVVEVHGEYLVPLHVQRHVACSCSCVCVCSELSGCSVSCPVLYLVVLVELFEIFTEWRRSKL